MHFQRLKDLRQDKDLNQTDVAKLLFVQRSVYARYELGIHTIPIEHLLVLADFYNTSTDYILGRTNEMKSYPKKK